MPLMIRSFIWLGAFFIVALCGLLVLLSIQFIELRHQQNQVIGDSLTEQTAQIMTDLLITKDTLSVNVILNQLTKNPLVTYVALSDSQNKLMAESGNRSLLMPSGVTGRFEKILTYQNKNVAHLIIQINQNHLNSPLIRALSIAFGFSLIMGVFFILLILSFRQKIAQSLATLKYWIQYPEDDAPLLMQNSEFGDIARQVFEKYGVKSNNKDNSTDSLSDEMLTDVDFSDDPDIWRDDEFGGETQASSLQNKKIKPLTAIKEDHIDVDFQADDFNDEPSLGAYESLASDKEAQATISLDDDTKPQSAILILRLGNQDLLMRLPKMRLLQLLEKYRQCLYEYAAIYKANLHILDDGSGILIFNEKDEDFLLNALCCGEKIRAMGHRLQIEVADCDLTLHLQMSLCLGQVPEALKDEALKTLPSVKMGFTLSNSSRNLLLIANDVADTIKDNQWATIRSLSTPEGVFCVERLNEPWLSQVENS